MSKSALENDIELFTYNRDSLLTFQSELNRKIQTDEEFINQMIQHGNNQNQLIFNSDTSTFEFVETSPDDNLSYIRPYDLVKGVDNCNRYLDDSIKQLDEVIKFLHEKYADN